MGTEFFFTYRLLQGRRTVRIGKGHVHTRDEQAIDRYLERRYGGRPWDSRETEWHSSESAALKAEERKIDSYERRMGEKPLWNWQVGGGGGTVYVLCRSLRGDGRGCRNAALVGLYGYCGVHAS